MGVRGHDHVVARLCCRDTAVCASPRHDGGTLRDISVEDLIPADYPLAVLGQKLLYPVGDISLKVYQRLLIVSYSELLHPCLTQRTFSPSCLRTFVSTDVDIFRREEFHDLHKDVFKEFERLLLSGTKDLRRHSPSSPYIVLLTCAAQLRI